MILGELFKGVTVLKLELTLVGDWKKRGICVRMASGWVGENGDVGVTNDSLQIDRNITDCSSILFASLLILTLDRG